MKKIHRDFVLISSKKKIIKVYLKDVFYLRKANNYTELVKVNGDEITICRSLKQTVTLMDSSSICKLCCHHAANLANVILYEKATRRMYFSDDIFIIVPEKKVALFYEVLNQNFIVL